MALFIVNTIQLHVQVYNAVTFIFSAPTHFHTTKCVVQLQTLNTASLHFQTKVKNVNGGGMFVHCKKLTVKFTIITQLTVIFYSSLLVTVIIQCILLLTVICYSSDFITMILLYSFKGDILCSFSGSYFQFGCLLEQVYMFNKHIICLITHIAAAPLFTLCLK